MNLLYPEDEDIAPYTFSPVDDELTVHRLVGEDGHQAALLNFGCHHGYRMLTGGGLLSIFSRLYLLRAADNFASLAVPSVVYPRCRRRCCPSQPQRGLPTADWRRLRIVDNSGRETVSERCVGFTVSRFECRGRDDYQNHPATAEAEYEEARQSVLA